MRLLAAIAEMERYVIREKSGVCITIIGVNVFQVRINNRLANYKTTVL